MSDIGGDTRVPADAPLAPGPARWQRWTGPLTALTLLGVALVVLRHELAAHTYREIAIAVRSFPRARMVDALLWTMLAYVVLPGYDLLALAYVGRLYNRSSKDDGGIASRGVGITRAGFAGLIAYGVSQTLGFAAVTGSAVRYRFWTVWGLSTAEIARAASFAAVTFTLGVVMVGGFALALEPASELTVLHLPPFAARAIGTAMLFVIAAFVMWSFHARGASFRINNAAARWIGASADGVVVETPRPALAIAQLVVAAVDWSAAAAVLWVLLPAESRPPFAAFAGLFVLAHSAGLISHVPGGLGVFETLMVLGLRPFLPAGATLAALVVYRAVYYLLPFGGAVALFATYETHQRSRRVRRVAAAAARSAGAIVNTARRTGTVAAALGPSLVPSVVAAAVFAAGAVLLISGATPSLRPRITALTAALPLGVIEASHLLGSVAGALLLVLAWALRRRLGAAWGLTVVLLVAGMVTSLLKGLDWEEALVQCAVLALLLPFKRAFYRRAALTAEPFEPGWIVAIVAVLGVTAWVGSFAFRHVEYANDLWWRIHPHADAPRFLRAMLASGGALAVFGAGRLLRTARPVATAPNADDLARAARIVHQSTDTDAYLALVGDKSLLFRTPDDERTSEGAPARAEDSVDGFVQYAVAGRSWVSMGDPVIADDALRSRDGDALARLRVQGALAWRFKEEADAHNGWPVFYKVGPETLPLYIDLGLTFLKLGEEARIDLRTFSLEGGANKWMRRAIKDVEKAGATFELIPAESVAAALPELRAVSDEWLQTKSAREKGFSLGYFDEAYLRHAPIAVVRSRREMGDGEPVDDRQRIVAFANLWTGAAKEALSVDLMRFSAHAPKGVMDYLFIQLMLWGQHAGFQNFNLGMAPLAGLEARELAPVWAKAGAWLYRHGEHFYNYDGLRRYKEKFDPIWEPRYLASPGGLALPRILANVAALIAGGITGIIRK